MCWRLYKFGLYSSLVLSGIDSSQTLVVTLGLNVVVKWVTWNLWYLFSRFRSLFYMPGSPWKWLICPVAWILSPGTIIGAFVVDYLGPKNTQVVGLVLQGIVGFIMSGLYKSSVSERPDKLSFNFDIPSQTYHLTSGLCSRLWCFPQFWWIWNGKLHRVVSC